MSARTKNPNAPAASSPKEAPVAPLSLRLPEKLRAQAVLCSDTTGLSMNGLICIALADYLAERGYKIHPK